jgi:serine/threonine protein kinase
MTRDPGGRHEDTGSWASDPRDVRVGELLNEFMDRRAAGEAVSPEQFLSSHPDYAPELSSHFASLGLIERLGRGDDGTVELDSDAARRSHSARLAPGPMPDIEGYELLREIGRGGMGLVYKARHKSTQRVVAVKVLLDGPLASEQNRKRFEREVALAAQLRHPNIIPIHDSGVADGRMYFAMEYIHGMPLAKWVKERAPSLAERLTLFTRIGRALAHAHQRGVIHRDIKPSNVLVDADGAPHVHDFGLAKAGSVQDVTLSITAQLVGTPAYMSPEQVAGDPSAIDTRTDVYSLGVILYELLTDETPYDVRGSLSDVLNNISHAEPTPPTARKPGLDDELDTITLKALEKNKDERYQTVAELVADIERYLAGDPIQAKKASPLYLLRKVIMRHRVYAATAAAVMLITAGSFWMGNWKRDTELLRQNEELRENQRELQEQFDAVIRQLSTSAMEDQIRELSAMSPELTEKSVEYIKRKLTPELRNSPNLAAAFARLAVELSQSVAIDGAPEATRPVGADIHESDETQGIAEAESRDDAAPAGADGRTVPNPVGSANAKTLPPTTRPISPDAQSHGHHPPLQPSGAAGFPARPAAFLRWAHRLVTLI